MKCIKKRREKRKQIEQTFIDLQLYCAQYNRVISHNLYFLEINSSQETFHKIGITTKDISKRIQEVKGDLSKLLESVSISLVGLWKHHGNVEHYFKYRYSEYNHPIKKLTEYFLFRDVEFILVHDYLGGIDLDLIWDIIERDFLPT